MDQNVLYHGQRLTLTRFWATGEPCLWITAPEQIGMPKMEFVGGHPDEYCIFLKNLTETELAQITSLDGAPLDAEKYLDTLRVGSETESNELFDKSHGFYIAVIQGFFRDYYYTRGSAFSFLAEEKLEYGRYFTPWAQVVPTALPNPAKNQIMENYCSGVYLSPNQVLQILRDLEQEPKVLEDLEKHWSDGQFAVLKKALTAAAELGTGLLEATEVVEPNPLHPNESTCYSNLFHCDRDGVYLYIDMAMKQIAQAMEQNKSDL